MAKAQPLDLSAIGLDQKALADCIVARAVDKIVSSILEDVRYDEDGEPTIKQSKFDHALRVAVDAQIKRITEKIGEETIAPKVEALIEGLTFQKTNDWGEPKQPPKTWRELLVERAEGWLTEQVSYEGKTKEENRGGCGWSPNGTRISYLVDKHLQYEISVAMKAALADANKKIAEGIHTAVKLQLDDLVKRLQGGAKL